MRLLEGPPPRPRPEAKPKCECQAPKAEHPEEEDDVVGIPPEPLSLYRPASSAAQPHHLARRVRPWTSEHCGDGPATSGGVL